VGGVVVRRLNLGCGSVQPEGWVNVDLYGVMFGCRQFDITNALDVELLADAHGAFDEIVANHLLSCFSHWELLDPVLPNILRLLKPGGVFRAMVPDARKAALAYLEDDASHFPLGDDLPSASERFCTFLPWFGESKSIFDERYLGVLLRTAGFTTVVFSPHHATVLGTRGIYDLDDREEHSLVMEARR
jgi:predicted SAM-dependent methyltransferase